MVSLARSGHSAAPSLARLLATLALAGCGAKEPAATSSGGAESGADGSTGQSSSVGSAGSMTSAGTTGVADESGGPTGGTTAADGDSGPAFVLRPDGGGDHECDIWTQDCPDGEKCAAWSNDGGAWNATKCVPVDANPQQPGDPCMVEGGGTSGIDNCALGAMCWAVDQDGMGVCVEQCTGTPDAPICSDPEAVCAITNMGSLILCLSTCDPILQNCPGATEACYLLDGVTITCGPDASGNAGVWGDPCEFDNVCDPGLLCSPSETVPDCQGSYGCCTEWCDVTLPNPESQCTGAAMGQLCVPFFEPGMAEPGLEHVGICAIPQ